MIHQFMNRFRPRFCCCLMLFVFMSSSLIYAQQPAFPGAEGFGRYTTGGRGGRVIEVTNLNDSGVGSLRAAVQASGSRTVVFRVSGTIRLNSRLNISNGNITIAGQTAPGDGICIADQSVTIDADNVIIRYLRFRLGDIRQTEDDAFNGRNHKNIIIDHCSMSWSIDEAASFYDNQNFTLQWSLIYESLYKSAHAKGEHGYGGIWGGMGASFHHNVLAHHTSRNPRFNGSRYHGKPEREIVDFRNNVIYNWGFNSAYGGEAGNQNMVANYFKYGPATRSDVRNRIVNPSDALGRWYVEDNFVFGYPNVTANNWSGGVQPSGGADLSTIRVNAPHPVVPLLTQTAENAFLSVLADAGAVRPKRDPLDERIVDEIRNGTATFGDSWGANSGIIDSQQSVGGWPELVSLPAPTDSDHDGMADEWELANNLDPTDPEDRNGDAHGDGYTNLETYLNSLCWRHDYLLAPAELTVSTVSSEELLVTWKEITPNENGFVIERSQTDTTNFTVVATVAANDTSYLDAGLAAGEVYYYRVHAVNETAASIFTNYAVAQTLYAGNLPLKPSDPVPANTAENSDVGLVLSWSPAIAATSYDVYFGNGLPPDFMAHQIGTSWRAPRLADSTTYYWRIDAVNDNGTTTGEVWSFTTETFVKTKVAAWLFDRGRGVIELDDTGNRNNVYLRNMDDSNWIDGLSGSALQFNGTDNYLAVNHSEWFDFSVRGFSINFFIKQQLNESVMPWLSKTGTNGGGFEIFSQGETVQFRLSDGDQHSILSAKNPNSSTDGWTMVTAVRRSETSELVLYANAELVATAPDCTWNISNNGDLYWATTAEQKNFLAGSLDEAAFYNYALDEQSIQNLYHSYTTSVRNNNDNFLPQDLRLSSYPNPFNEKTVIRYSVPESEHVNLTLFNALGQRVEVLVDAEKTAGFYQVHYETAHLSSGVYFIHIQAGVQSDLSKILLLR